MKVWRLIKKLERAAWARKYSELQDARAELAEVFGPAPASELLEADHRYTTREIDRIARSLTSASLVRCKTCNTMTHIPTGTVCALCLANVAAAFEVRSGLQAQRLAEREPGCTGDDSCPLHHHGTLFERSTTPMFSSKVPEPGAAGGAITFADIAKWAQPIRISTPLNPERWDGLPFVDPVKWLQTYDPGLLVNPVCEHGVPCANVSAFKSCFVCGTSAELRRPKQVRRQSGGSCDCPTRDGEPCLVREVECRVRAYHNSRLSVRSWFRKMRAAEFERDLPGRERVPLVRSHASMYEPWTLFHTQAIVDRETAPHYRDTLEHEARRRLFDPFYDGTR
jgi:hypothetical protein